MCRRKTGFIRPSLIKAHEIWRDRCYIRRRGRQRTFGRFHTRSPQFGSRSPEAGTEATAYGSCCFVSERTSYQRGNNTMNDGHSGIGNSQVDKGGSGSFQLILAKLKQGNGQADLVIHATSNTSYDYGLDPWNSLQALALPTIKVGAPFTTIAAFTDRLPHFHAMLTDSKALEKCRECNMYSKDLLERLMNSFDCASKKIKSSERSASSRQ